MVAPKKTPAGGVKRSTPRPQLDKMSPTGYTKSGKSFNGVALSISGATADRRNASYAYNRNPANKMKQVVAINKATKKGAKRKGGK